MSISISPQTILTFVGLVVLTWMLVAAGGTLLVIFVSVFLAVVLSPVVDAACKRLKLGRGAASSLVVLGLSVLVGLLLLVALSQVRDGGGRQPARSPGTRSCLQVEAWAKRTRFNGMLLDLVLRGDALVRWDEQKAAGAVMLRTDEPT